MERILFGAGIPGTRAAPTQAGNNDAKIGLRLDYGERFKIDGKEYLRVNLQVNKGAENPTLRALANKNSHEVWSYADILIEQVEAKKNVAGGSEDGGIPMNSGPPGHTMPAQAGRVKDPSPPKKDPVKEKAEKMFEDLEVNLRTR